MICLSIVSHGQRDLAVDLLACIARDASPLVRQIVYTRNVPEPALPDRFAALPGLDCIDNPRPAGFGRNHNAAFARCREPLFCVLNPDIGWARDPFVALAAALGVAAPETARLPGPTLPDGDRQRPLGLVAPLVVRPDGAIEPTGRALYTIAEMIGSKLHPSNRSIDADWLAGMFLLFRSDAFRQIGGFDERYFLYIEDVDISSRLRLAGWRLRQCADATVVHDARHRSHRSLRHARWHLAGMLRYWTSPAFWRYRSLLAQEARTGPLDAATRRRRRT
ncbi:MAG: glycosyltransferase [Lautropia sp.]